MKGDSVNSNNLNTNNILNFIENNKNNVEENQEVINNYYNGLTNMNGGFNNNENNVNLIEGSIIPSKIEIEKISPNKALSFQSIPRKTSNFINL